MNKTDQTIRALKEIAQRNPYCEIRLTFLVHKTELTGFDIIEIKNKFRAKEDKGNKVEAAV